MDDAGTLLDQELALARAGLVVRDDLGCLDVVGPERASFLQGLVTNDVVALAVGESCNSALLDHKGYVEWLFVVSALEDRLRLVLERREVPLMLARLDEFLIRERVELCDRSRDLQWFSLQGREVRAVKDAIPHDDSGFGGYWVFAEREDARAVYQDLCAQGAAPVGPEAAEAARIAAGIPRLGVDVDRSTFLPELPMKNLVSFTKGCYRGQEPVARTVYRGHANRFLTALTLEGETQGEPEGENVPPRGCAVFHAGHEVGRLTSAALSRAARAVVALGILRREVQQPDTQVQLGTPSGPTASVRPLCP